EPAAEAPAPVAAAPVQAPAAPVQTLVTPAQTSSAVDTVVQPQPAPKAEPKFEPKTEAKTEPLPVTTEERKPVARPTLPAATTEQPKTITARVAPAEPKDEPVKTEATSPIGLWWTEKKESKIRIEACGDALCGYVEGKPTDKVLTNMKAGQ